MYTASKIRYNKSIIAASKINDDEKEYKNEYIGTLSNNLNLLKVNNPIEIIDSIYNMYDHLNNVTAQDKEIAANEDISLCYGEILYDGVEKIFDQDHLNIYNAKRVYDFGAGLGKLVCQAF